jgi:hypothetical protein
MINSFEENCHTLIQLNKSLLDTFEECLLNANLYTNPRMSIYGKYVDEHFRIILDSIHPEKIDISILVLIKVLHEEEHYWDIFMMSCIVIYNPLLYNVFEMMECNYIFDELCSSCIEEMTSMAVLLGYFSVLYSREYVKGLMRISKWRIAISIITNMGNKDFIEEFIFPTKISIESIADKEALNSIILIYPECIYQNSSKVFEALYASNINVEDLLRLIN